MKSIKLIAASALLLAALAGSNPAQAAWLGTDVGTPGLPGSAVDNGDGTMTISGSGADIWGNSDQFFFYYTNVTSVSWDAVVRVHDLQGPDQWTKAELMVRWADPLTPGVPAGPDPHISAMTTRAAGQNYVESQYRATRGGGSGEGPNPAAPTYPNTWLRVNRFGPTFTLYRGTDGVNWTVMDTFNTTSANRGFGTAWPESLMVGVAVTAHNNTGLGVAIISDLKVTLNPVVPPTTLTVAKQVVSTSVYTGTQATFSFDTTNNGTAGLYFPAYQWYKNNQRITNATGQTLTFLAHAFENGAQIYCNASFAAYGLSLNSATGTVTTLAGSVMVTNGLKIERFYGASRTGVEAGNVSPVTPSVIAALDIAGGFGDNYSQRASGWFKPSVSGNYTFYVASDDDADVFLSTDASAANKRLIAQEMGWSPFRNYLTSGSAGTGDDQQKCSETWQADLLNPIYPALYETGIALVANNLYYLETVMHQGGGGDNLSVTYRLTADVGTVLDGSVSMLASSNNNLVFITSPTTNLVWTTQPTNTTVNEGQSATFRSVAFSDTELALGYQWYRNNAIIAGATGPNYSLGATVIADSGAQFKVVANTQAGGLSITSTVATLTVIQSVFERGYVKVEFWGTGTNNPSRATIIAGNAGPPVYVTTSPAFEAGINGESGNDYGRRLSGFFVPATSGLYDFFVNSDDDSDLFVGTSDSVSTKRLVAQESGWSGVRNWVGVGGGSSAAQKRSDSWIPAGGTVAPFAAGISLNANTRYYMEMVQHEGGGGDNASATMKVHGGTDPVANQASLLTGNLVGMLAVRCSYVAYTQQPQNTTAISSMAATFTAAGVTDSKLPVGVIGDPRPLVNNPVYVIYRWMKNGVIIPGAISSTLTLPAVRASDNGAQIVCQIRALGLADAALNPIWSNSAPATLTVSNVPSVFQHAAYVPNDNHGFGVAFVTLAFDKGMDVPTCMNAANYTLSGGLTKTGVIIVNTNSYRNVAIQVSGTFGSGVTVSASGLLDSAGLPVAVPTSVVHAMPLTTSDIGTPGYDPVFPSMLYVDGPKAYTIVAQGSDFWANADGGNLSWETKTGNFDVVTRVKSLTFTSTWAKGGLMARETLDAGSRNWNIVCTPALGANGVEANSRTTTDGGSAGFDGARPAPAYPNAWVRLARSNDVIRAYYATNGIDWTLTGTQNATMVGSSNALPAAMYVGLCNTAHNNDVYGVEPYIYWCEAQFADYNPAFVATPLSVTLSVGISGTNAVVSWTPRAGRLMMSPVLGPAAVWTAAPAGNPASVPLSSGQNRFFRVMPW